MSRHTWLLVSTILASSMAFIDSTALNVVLPALQKELDASGSGLLWIINGYNLPVSSFILLGGALGDRYGLKKVFSLGLMVFVVGSLLCGIAPTVETLVAARAIKGLGGAFMIPGSLALISAAFDSKSRGKAIGTWSAFSTLTTIAGPILGGVLAEYGLWRWIFFVNLPLGVAALYGLSRSPEIKVKTKKKPVDYPGALLVSVSLGLIAFGALEGGGEHNPDSNQNILLFLGIMLASLFVYWEKKTKNPMLPLSVFESRTFSGANILTVSLYSTLYGVLFFLPLNLIQIQGYSETIAGATMLPFALLLTIMSRFTGAWTDRVGPRKPLAIGTAIVGIAYITLTIPGVTEGPSAYLWTYFPGIFLLGVGMGFVVAPLTATVMGCLGPAQSGLASGINNAASRVSGVLAIAFLGAIAISIFSAELESGLRAVEVTDQLRLELMSASNRLGGIEIDHLSTDVQSTVRPVIQESFVSTFRWLCQIGAFLSFLSAVVALLYISPKIKK